MAKALLIIGGRPQIVKAFPLLRLARDRFVIVDTGQHYSKSLSEDLYNDLKLPQPDFKISCKADSSPQQISKIISSVDKIIKITQPYCGLVFGDMNSTLAGAIAFSKNNIPIIHIESGTRSGNRQMSEEINRISVDHMSQVLFAPNTEAVQNLKKEGFQHFYSRSPSKAKSFPIVISGGDIMLEALNLISPKKCEAENFCLLTIHRKENISNRKKLHSIINFISNQKDSFVFPVHPHTLKRISEFNLKIPNNIKIIKALPYSKLINYASRSDKIFTDSGGLSKEATWLGKPCIILRQETEHNELIKEKRAVLYRNYRPSTKFKNKSELNKHKTSQEVLKSLNLLKK